MNTAKLCLALVPLLLSACDTLYHSQQAAGRAACEKLPNPQEMRDCLQRHSDRYDQYQKQREVLKSGASE